MKNIVVCTNLDEHVFDQIKTLQDKINLKDSVVHLIHCWKIEAYTFEFMVPIYPSKEVVEEIIQSMESVLKEQSNHFSSLEGVKGQSKVLRGVAPKDEVLNYIKDVKADLVVCVTKEKEGLEGFFHSSFTTHMTSHAPCDVLAIRA